MSLTLAAPCALKDALGPPWEGLPLLLVEAENEASAQGKADSTVGLRIRGLQTALEPWVRLVSCHWPCPVAEGAMGWLAGLESLRPCASSPARMGKSTAFPLSPDSGDTWWDEQGCLPEPQHSHLWNGLVTPCLADCDRSERSSRAWVLDPEGGWAPFCLFLCLPLP